MPVSISGDSPQAVAYALLEQVARAEDWAEGAKTASQSASRPWRRTREEILAAYKECLAAVLEIRRWGSAN